MSVVGVFRQMISSANGLNFEVHAEVNEEETVSASFEGEGCIANATIWARPHVGGLVDFSVIDMAGTQWFWRHLEAPTEADVRAAWTEMLKIIATLERN